MKTTTGTTEVTKDIKINKGHSHSPCPQKHAHNFSLK